MAPANTDRSCIAQPRERHTPDTRHPIARSLAFLDVAYFGHRLRLIRQMPTHFRVPLICLRPLLTYLIRYRNLQPL